MKFVCKICGYVYEGETAPEQCPQCKQHGVMEPVSENKNPYAGTQTEKTWKQPLQVSLRPETNTLILLPKQKKRALSRSRLSF